MAGYALICLLLAAAIAAQQDQGSERHKRLTSFAKAPEKPKQTGYLKIECSEDSDCKVPYTSCITDRDGKSRCICEDNKYPIGSKCAHIREKRGYVPKGNNQPKKETPLRKNCKSSEECIEGAECKVNPNSTSHIRVCLCTEDTVEEDGECNGSHILLTSGLMMIVLSLSHIWPFITN